MSGQRFALLDPAAGISGDMLLGALVHAGAPRDWLQGLPARLGVSEVSVEIADTLRSGIRAAKVTLRLADGETEGPGDVPEDGHHHGDDHGHHGTHHHDGAHGSHRHVGELLERIRVAPVSDWVKTQATRAFTLLAEAEGRVHGIAPERVSLHEVGALDALVDIVGCVEGFERLGVTEVYSRPVALGNGWVRAAHGVLPVPTPATAILAEGLTIAPDGPVLGEATTPTGAALLRALSRGAPRGAWRAVRSGWGAGTRDPEGYPNALRLVLAERVVEAAEVAVIATDLDDLSPEYLEPLREALAAAGALDVQAWPTQMKKGRIGFRVEALSPPECIEEVTQAFFRHSTTAGVRRWSAERNTLRRRTWELETRDGDRIRIKTLESPEGPRVKPEFEDVKAAAQRTGRPAHELAREFQEDALRLVRTQAGEIEGPDHPEKESSQ